ncbi:non-specific lipid-transfer protein 1-like [Vigna umbellata]|uniref:non-specific lipid-transfer protein 1-like n=1 Tax=Vigna umbellata TaxID=87088 RepID=UPI001F5FD61F|nr:non-specific lipid-transfer protein 1-like [Vigna umbellata]
MASVKVACMVVMCMAVMSAPMMMVQAVTCDQVTASLAPCLGYLMNGGAAAPGCCSGVKNILGAAGSSADKQTVCKCLKDAAGKYNINEQYAQALPGVCKVNIPYKISRSTNCADIRF